MIAIQRRAVVDEYRQFSFNRNSVAFGQNGRLYYPHQARFESVGGRVGVLIEEETTNLLPTSKAEAEANPDVTQNAIRSIDTTRMRTGSGSLRVEWNGSGSYSQAEYRLNVTPGQTYTFSAYAYVEIPGYKGEIILQEGATPYRQVGSGLVDLIPGQWNRLYVTWAVPSDIQLPLRCIVRAPRDAGGQYVNGVPIWWDSLQLEQKPYATSWTLGTRSPDTLTVPTAGVLQAQEATIEFWAYVNEQVRDTSRIRRFFSHFNGAGNANRITIQHNNTPDWLFTIANSNGNTYSLGVSDSYTPDGWHYFAMVWSASRFAVFIDGVKRGELLNPTYLPQSLAATFDIGHTGGGVQPNTYIGPLRISRRARTDQEIADAYAAGTLTADADTTLLLPFTGPDAQRGARTLYVPAVGF